MEEMNDIVISEPDLAAEAEMRTIAAVMAGINSGFNPRGTKILTIKQVVDASCIIVAFMREAVNQRPDWSVSDWCAAVEELKISLGSKP